MNDMLDHEVIAALADILDEAPAPAARPPLVAALLDRTRSLESADDGEAEEVDLGRDALVGRPPRGRRVLVACAIAVLTVAAGLAVAQARRGADPDHVGATDTASASTAPGPAVTEIDGPFVRLVVPHLPSGFQAVSTGRILATGARPYVVALDRMGRIATVSFGRFNREAAREPAATTTAPGITGSAANATYSTPAGDTVTATCLLGAQPCGDDGPSAGTVFDGRALAGAVATAVAALSDDERNRLTSVSSLADDADIAKADAVLDRISSTLGAGYALIDSGGPVAHRTWRTTSGTTRVVTVYALASPLRVEPRSASTGDVASAVASGGGWVFVAVARPGEPVAEANGPAPDPGAFLRRQLLYGLSALETSPLVNPREAAGEGRLVLEGIPAGWRVESAFDRRSTRYADDLSTTRLYGSRSSTPERSPWISLLSAAGEMGLDPHGDGVEAVRVQNTAGQLALVGSGGLRLSFGPVGDRWAVLESSGLSRERFLALAETVIRAPDGPGLAIRTSALPEGMVELAVGAPSDSWLVPLSAQDAPMPGAHWTDGRNLVWYTSVRADASLLPSFRLGYGTASDVTVGGRSAIMTEMDGVRRLAWADGDRLYLVGSNSVDGNGPGVPTADLLALANRLRPATTQQWSDMLAATASPGVTAPTTTIVTSG